MLSHGLKFFTDIPITLIGMILFMIAFFGVTAWTFLRSQSKEFYQKVANLPLTEEQQHE